MSEETINAFQTAPDSKKMLTLLGIYVGVIANIFITVGMSTLLPAAAAEIGGIEYYPLATTIGGVLGIMALPMAASIGTKNPELKRVLFVAFMIVSAVVMIGYSLAPSMMVIVGISVFYGFLSVAAFGLGYPMIRDMFDAQRAGVYLGAVGTIMSIGMLAGPVATGLVIDGFGWRAVCHILWPVELISALLVFIGVKVTKKEVANLAVNSGGFDVAGALAMMVMLAGFVLALSFGTSYIPFGGIANYALLAMAVIGLFALVFIIRKKGAGAIIPAPVLKDRNTLIFTLNNFLGNLAGLPAFFFLPLFMINVLGSSATEAGIAILLFSVIGLFLSPILGKMIAKAGTAKPVLIMGTIVRIIVGTAFVFVLVPGVPAWVLYILMFIAGIYSSQQLVTFSVGPQIQIKPEMRTQSNSVIQVAQNLGSMVSRTICTLFIGILGVAGGVQAGFIMALAASVLYLILGLFLKKLEPADAQKG
jgi:MFS family permease